MHVVLRKSSRCALRAFWSSTCIPISIADAGSRRLSGSSKDYRPAGNVDQDAQVASGFIGQTPLLRAERPDRPIFHRVRYDHHRVHEVLSTNPTRTSPPSDEADPYATFARVLLEHWGRLQSSLGYWPRASPEVRNWGVLNKDDFDAWLLKFDWALKHACVDAKRAQSAGKKPRGLFVTLGTAYIAHGATGLPAKLKAALEFFVKSKGFSRERQITQKRLADFRYPIEWYPEARTIQRKIHLHVGPTNSGKTYHALQRLEVAESGIYAGPLRLLAHEVYTLLNAKNKLCALITGEERRIPETQDPYLISCTVEMVPLKTMVDVAVIDEIQMIGDPARGWAWTQAFLGVKAREVHLCGEVRTIPLIQQLCAMTGDSLEIHKYERLSPLKVMKSSLKGDLKKLEKGDAFITFSRLDIHSMKGAIEIATGKRCAVVYGSLPPETRAQQASLFNDPNNDYDFLVASDAIGMGLNLSIKRIILKSTRKRTDTGVEDLRISEIKQIAGRAGRYRTATQAVEDDTSPEQEGCLPKISAALDVGGEATRSPTGLVTTLQEYHMPTLKRAMASEAPPLATAGLLAPDGIIARFASHFPLRTSLSYILLRLNELSSISPHLHLCELRSRLEVADAIQEYDLTINDRLRFIASPANLRKEGAEPIIKALAKCVADQTGGELLGIKEINLDILDEIPTLGNKQHLVRLESLHRALTLYLWLSYRFAGVFRSQALAFHVKALVEEKIDASLARIELDPQKEGRTSVPQQVAEQSTTESDSKIEEARPELESGTNPYLVLWRLGKEPNTFMSMPRYSKLGRVDESDESDWRACVSVKSNGQVVKAVATGASQQKAKWNAAQAVLEKISSSIQGPTQDSLSIHHAPEEIKPAVSFA